ncbi:MULTISPECIES: GON domain-containing protein [Actinosynnema]|uniref:GON domain-containing protein n=1 Tax=Actinosynnema TaxID=40566 RepID=UPI0020A2C6C4|nr:GON domain-containing protein [Actinosynnema pretiosum]MCP2094401.1 GON domain-containing protein [Actinosynnema pretiosum]
MGTAHRSALAACAALASVVALGAAPATADAAPAPRGLLDSCAAIRRLLPIAPDGPYVLITADLLLGVHCHDMAGTPREYLNLPDTGGATNFSQYTAGGASPGTSTRTTFSKLRVDPATLTVDIGDLTFATSTGSLTHGVDRVTSMPYATAMSCDGTASGVASVDLRGTAFAVDDTFAPAGAGASGAVAVAHGGQLVDITGGGYCGWNVPAPGFYNPYNPQVGMSALELSCAPAGLLRPQPCVRLG